MLKHHYYPKERFLQLHGVINKMFDSAKWEEIKKFPIHKICNAIRLTKELGKGSFAEKLVNGKLN